MMLHEQLILLPLCQSDHQAIQRLLHCRRMLLSLMLQGDSRLPGYLCRCQLRLQLSRVNCLGPTVLQPAYQQDVGNCGFGAERYLQQTSTTASCQTYCSANMRPWPPEQHMATTFIAACLCVSCAFSACRLAM